MRLPPLLAERASLDVSAVVAMPAGGRSLIEFDRAKEKASKDGAQFRSRKFRSHGSGRASRFHSEGVEPVPSVEKLGKKMRRKLTAITLLVAAMSFGSMPSAMAATYGPFNKNCSPQYVEVQSEARYQVQHYYPSSTLKWIFSNSNYQIRKTHTGVQSTSWKVTADDAIRVSGTKANCVGVG